MDRDLYNLRAARTAVCDADLDDRRIFGVDPLYRRGYRDDSGRNHCVHRVRFHRSFRLGNAGLRGHSAARRQRTGARAVFRGRQPSPGGNHHRGPCLRRHLGFLGGVFCHTAGDTGQCGSARLAARGGAVRGLIGSRTELTPTMRSPEIEGLEFTSREFDPDSGEVRLRWRLFGNARALVLEERFGFGRSTGGIPPGHPSFQAALDLLHWIAGVSYWKVACRGAVRFAAARPDAFQADALAQVYRNGLAELAWRNHLEGRYWPDFDGAEQPVCAQTATLGLASRALVPMGGGKDSLVALERVRACHIDAETVQVGSAPLIGRVAERAGTRHHVIQRKLAPELAALNAAGALNGHIPITAINASALVVAALL